MLHKMLPDSEEKEVSSEAWVPEAAALLGGQVGSCLLIEPLTEPIKVGPSPVCLLEGNQRTERWVSVEEKDYSTILRRERKTLFKRGREHTSREEDRD